MFLAIFVFVLVLGILVFVHELGHFLVSKKNGVTPEEFGFGFPPRILGVYFTKKGARKIIWGNKEIPKEALDNEKTLYSINWIPLGGFVRIKGEDGSHRKDPKSFASQSIWVKFKILIAGVVMNVVFGAFLFSVAFWIGLPEAISDEEQVNDSKVQIARIKKDSPAEVGGLKMGDSIIFIKEEQGVTIKPKKTAEVQSFIKDNSGEKLTFSLERAGEKEDVEVIVDLSINNEDSSVAGVEIVRTTFVKYGPLKSIWLGIRTTYLIIVQIFLFLFDLIGKIFTSQQVEAEVAGPVGIAVLTSQVSKMGLAFILQFAAMLSVNLAVINILPIPALDGGRILFLLIEKIKGKPLNEKTEGIIHAMGFFLLIGLMIFVTIKDFSNFEIFSKIKGLF